MPTVQPNLTSTLAETFALIDHSLSRSQSELATQEVGRVISVGQGVAQVRGIPGVQAEELIRFHGGTLGMAYNLDPEEVGVVLLGSSNKLIAGIPAYRTGRILDVPVGDQLIGRVVSALGQPLDDQGPLRMPLRRTIERPAPPIMHRAPVTKPLQTGIKAIDSLLPIGRGQRELIVGDRQTGKTAIALDTILNQRNTNVLCVYCAIGQRNSAVAKFLAQLQHYDALKYTLVVVASGDDSPGVQFIAPYAATTMAEYFMEQGRDVLIIYDDLTRHARAYRELSLLLRRPPGREAYPGDIFYLHSRLLERSTHLREEYGGGSLTALPIAETQSQNISAYIPTNLISITDGQIVLSPDLFRKGNLPAIDVGKSVSRVGGKAQLPCYRSVAGELRLSYSQFEELEVFARFGTRIDDETRKLLERGRRVREVFKQMQYETMPPAEQVAVLLAAIEGVLNQVPLANVHKAEQAICEAVNANLSDLLARMTSAEKLMKEDREELLKVAAAAIESLKE
ncbi:alternate F1F0 ATPase, F1 subunit alpha [Schlesneria sp. DSM 10557]|uniref:alternate F1F0 ATPase, F1 subunit alpha n=1 Tax=Schlesneria sp. DSM 10557 TaxID=3044399 RepID=UPI00359FA294